MNRKRKNAVWRQPILTAAQSAAGFVLAIFIAATANNIGVLLTGRQILPWREFFTYASLSGLVAWCLMWPLFFAVTDGSPPPEAVGTETPAVSGKKPKLERIRPTVTLLDAMDLCGIRPSEVIRLNCKSRPETPEICCRKNIPAESLGLPVTGISPVSVDGEYDGLRFTVDDTAGNN